MAVFTRSPHFRALCTGVVASLVLIVPGHAQQWEHYGGDAGGQKFSALQQINTGNVGKLTVAWQYRTGELERHPTLQTAVAKFRSIRSCCPPRPAATC